MTCFLVNPRYYLLLKLRKKLFPDALLLTSFSLANRLVESVVLALFLDTDAVLFAFAKALSSLESFHCLSSLSPD